MLATEKTNIHTSMTPQTLPCTSYYPTPLQIDEAFQKVLLDTEFSKQCLVTGNPILETKKFIIGEYEKRMQKQLLPLINHKGYAVKI